MKSRKTFEDKITRCFSNLCENYKPRDPRSQWASMDIHKENHRKTHNNEIDDHHDKKKITKILKGKYTAHTKKKKKKKFCTPEDNWKTPLKTFKENKAKI